MVLKILYSIFAFFVVTNSYSQRLIDVANLNVNLSFQETRDYFFTFDKGDEIVFNFEMKKGRHIKSIEIASSSNVKLTEFKAKEITNKKIQVPKKEIYRFRFFSSSLTTRVANVRIQRIPVENGNPNFNTGWKWRTVRDTGYIPYKKDSLIGYQMIPYKETVKELIETKVSEIMLFEKSQSVHSYYNKNKSKTYLQVNLPRIENTNLKQEKILSWAYWIGVGQEGREAYKKNVKSFSGTLSKAVTTYYRTPLAGIAVGAITDLFVPKIGEDVSYYFIRSHEDAIKFYTNQQFFQFDMGKGRAAYGRNDKYLNGSFYIGLSNDNLTRGIDVDVKVVVIKETKIYKYKTYQRERKEGQYVTLNKIRIQLRERKYRVPVE